MPPLALLTQAGYLTASEVELRIDPDARPKPDIIASKTKPAGPYPTSGVDVVVEIVRKMILTRDCVRSAGSTKSGDAGGSTLSILLTGR
jgi:hypothetical protein